MYGWNNLDSDFMRQHIEMEIRQQNDLIENKQSELDEIHTIMARLKSKNMCNTQEYLKWKGKCRAIYNALDKAQKRLTVLQKDLKKYK